MFSLCEIKNLFYCMNDLEKQYKTLINDKYFKTWLSSLSARNFENVFSKLQFGQTGNYFPLRNYGSKLMKLRKLKEYHYISKKEGHGLRRK